MIIARMLGFLCLGLLSTASLAQKERGIAIVGANVLPMTGAKRLADQTVLIQGARITALGPRRKVRVPHGFRAIDARGLTLMPGLVDTHVHLDNTAGEKSEGFERGLAVMLAHGITTARGAVGMPSLPSVRGRIERGEIAGPRLYVGTAPLNGENTKDAAGARRQVAAAKGQGFDFIKVHDLEPEVWQAVVDEAAKAGLPVVGHVTDKIGIFRALAARQQVEHLEMVPRELFAPGAPARNETFGQIPPPHLAKLFTQIKDQDFRRVAAQVKAAGGYHGPTLAFFERVYDVAAPAERLLAEPGMPYASRPIVTEWAEQRRELNGMITPESGRIMRDLRRKIVRAFYQAGVPMMAGSAAPEVYQAYGEGLIRDLETYVEIGLTPMDALRSATVIPRDYLRTLSRGGSALGWRANFGTIEPGARADVILLAQDPSKNVSALRSLRTVVAAGKLYDRAALDSILRKAAAAAKR